MSVDTLPNNALPRTLETVTFFMLSRYDSYVATVEPDVMERR
jgi:hypothetical protein